MNFASIGNKDRRGDEFVESDFNFPFTDKESYQKWVADWKAEYSIHSATIRERKAACKQLQVANDPDAPGSQSNLAFLSLEARGYLVARKYAKQHSWRMKKALQLMEVGSV
jgi:hypothetical protein